MLDGHLNAEEEKDPLVVHVVDLLVSPHVERSQAWMGGRQQLLRVAKPKEIYNGFNFFTLPLPPNTNIHRDKPSHKLFLPFTQVFHLPDHRLVDVLQRVRPRHPAVVGHHPFRQALTSHVAGHRVPKELVGSEQT